MLPEPLLLTRPWSALRLLLMNLMPLIGVRPFALPSVLCQLRYDHARGRRIAVAPGRRLGAPSAVPVATKPLVGHGLGARPSVKDYGNEPH